MARKIKTMSEVKRMRLTVASAPADMTARLLLADALEDEGSQEAALQRALIKFVELVQSEMSIHYRVEATDGPAWIRIYTTDQDRHADQGRRLYCWVRKSDGVVKIGTWHGPATKGPDRFSILADDAVVWCDHIGPYGLRAISPHENDHGR